MKKYFIVLMLLAFTVTRAEDFYKASVTFTNGETKEGYASLPSNKLTAKAVRFKTAAKGKDEALKEDDITSVLYTTKDGKQFMFEHTPIRQAIGKREKTSKRKIWALLIFSASNINCYYFAQDYSMDKNGVVSKAVDRTGTWAEIQVMFKRPGEEAPTIITAETSGAMIVGKDKMFRKAAALYFAEDAPIVKRIEDDEFKNCNYRALAEAFEAYKAEK